METIKLFYEDPYLQQFTARVVSCQEGKNGFEVVLDRTAFYPEGGGQPADHGTLDGVKVVDTREKAGNLVHICEKPLEVGAEITGTIDWARRFDHMQQHSGEHIVSGMLCSDYHCDNVGFHLGEQVVTIDYNADIPWEGVLDIERRANAYIWENHPFVSNWYAGDELAALAYRSKKPLQGAVRIAEFPGADRCACCGTHVLTAGQVGLVKFLSCQKFRDGVRLELLCGERAYRYLSACFDNARGAGQMLSVPAEKVAPAVERLLNELAQVKTKADTLETAALTGEAEAYRGKGDVVVVRQGLRGDNVRRFCDMIAAVCGGRAAVFGGEEGAYQFAVIDNANDVGPAVKAMNAALHGRGGGKGGFAQGKVAATEQEILDHFKGETR